MRHRKPENYLAAAAAQRHGIAEVRALDRAEQASEALLMGLRLAEGVDLADMARRFGGNPAALIDQAKAQLYHDLGMVWSDGDRFGVTEQGMPLLDALLGELVAPDLVAS